MNRKLLTKLVLLYAACAVVMFVLLNSYGVEALKENLVEKRKESLYEEATVVESEYVMRFYENTITISKLMQELSLIGTFIDSRIWIINLDGRVIGDTERVFGMTVNVLEYQEDFFEHTFLEDVYFKGVFAEPMLCVTVPITYEYSVKGYVCLQTPMRAIKQESIYYMDFINICYLIFLVFMLLTFGCIYCMTVLPVKKILLIAKEYSKGHFEKSIVLRQADEYRDLANTVNYMGEELALFDAHQRELIANISHDFRSPLTSIKGYAEAMKDGTIPYELQEKYLDVMLFEVERLTKLTSNLLALNSFEQGKMQLTPVDFDINAMIKQVARTFEGSCKKKRLVMKLIFSDQELFVTADKDKIERVLYNLVDNAIKFSNTDSSVRIVTEVKGMKAMIAVKDFGIGIPKEALGRIWERFYKTDLSRGKDKKGTGLGLSIVKEILNAHKENINVISTEGVGTEFVFTLPLSKNEE